MDFGPFFAIYLLFLAFYMPTLALANTTTFAILKANGLQPVDRFPSIRIWGTIGFVAAMWFVNSAYIFDGTLGFTLSDFDAAARHRFQYNSYQLLASAVTGFITTLYILSLPDVKSAAKSGRRTAKEIFGLTAFSLFRKRPVRIFLIFAIFTGVCLQVSNGFVIPYINHFMGIPEFKGSLAAGNATMLFSLSQIAEAACILLVGVAMKRLGFKWVVVIALTAWCLRFLCLGTGNPADGLWLLVASMLAYGIAFDFFSIAGHIYIDQMSDSNTKGFGQGLLMMMTNGIGATFGMIAAGAVVNNHCHWEMVSANGTPMRLFMGDWTTPWLIFAAYALIVGLLFALFYRHDKTCKSRDSLA